MRRAILPICFLTCLGSCIEIPEVDVTGIRVVHSSLQGPRSVEIEVKPQLIFRLSEPVDPATITPSTVVIVPWEEVGRCELTPLCEKGSCERGRCQIDSLSSTDLGDIDQGEFVAEIPLEIEVVDSEAGPHTQIIVTPLRSLAPHWRHSLVLGAGIRDRQGAPLVDQSGQIHAWRQDFVTAHEGSSGPEAHLYLPRPGEVEVPTNLQRIETHFARPLARDLAMLMSAQLELEAEDGSVVWLAEPTPCTDWVRGFCFAWRPHTELKPNMRYRPRSGSILDLEGRPAIAPRDLSWFKTAASADSEPPSLAGLSVHIQGSCVHVGLVSDELVTLQANLKVGEYNQTIQGYGGGYVEVATRVPEIEIQPDDMFHVAVTVSDLAGNSQQQDIELLANENFAAGVPLLNISEVLANPAGSEPKQEFVELVDMRKEGEEQMISGLYLADLPWSEVELALTQGEKAPGDAVPDFLSNPGQRTIILGSGYDWADSGEDPKPSADAIWVQLESSIADGGLKNAGEPITLYAIDPPRLVTSYGNFIDTGKSDHNGRSVVATSPWVCDQASAWRSHPLGTSSPGWEP